MSLQLDEKNSENRFFTSEQNKSEDNGVKLDHSNLGIGDDEDVESELGEQKCLTLRLLQRCLPWFKSKTVWEPSQGDVFKKQEVEEVKYPAVLKLLERPFCEFIFVFSSLLSVFLLLFSQGFLLESRIMWGIIHLNNFVYTFCVFGMWLEILVQSKYAKTKQGFTTKDSICSLISVIPVDIIVLVIHILNDDKNDDENPISPYITISRLTYLFRLRNVLRYFQKWEDQLAFGDFKMFLIRTSLYGLFLVHLIACCFHGIACQPFKVSHFRMRPSEATTEVCKARSNWVLKLLTEKNKFNKDSPLMRHEWHVLVEHYLVSVYWAVVTIFRLGASDITASFTVNEELAFTSVVQIVAWIFVIAYISGSLTSILVEIDTEKQNFLTRRFAIEKYLDFSYVTREIRNNVNRFYDYLWARSRGIHNWGLVEQMPLTMKAEIYYDVNRFVLDQLPLLANLEEAFLMNLSVHMKHSFFLRGETLCKRGQNGAAMYYVINGHLNIMHEDEVHVIAEIRSGSAIGDLFLLQSYPIVASVRCGSECDIMVLQKDDFKKVLRMYPEYMGTLQKRVDSRLEQSGLLLALCDKHNEHPTAYKRLHNHLHEAEESRDSYYRNSYEMITNILDPVHQVDIPEGNINSDDFDDLDLDGDVRQKLSSLKRTSSIREKERKMSLHSVIAAVSLAIEADVSRATSLAKDLNIPRPPIIVKAPNESHAPTPNSDVTGPFTFLTIPRRFNISDKNKDAWKLWKVFVLCCICPVVWYYPYQFAFKNHTYSFLDYVGHVADLIFAVDCVLDNLQPIVLPHKTLESYREILSYRAKTFYFYIRIFSFLPIEYVLGPMIGWRSQDNYFYLLKFNRLIQYYEGMRFFKIFEADTRVPPQFLFVFRFAIRLFFAIHGIAISFEVILKQVPGAQKTGEDKFPVLDEPERRFYEFVYYWAIEVMTGTGYGDFPLREDYEIAATVLGLIAGVSMIVFLNARLSAIMANAERRRVSFKQTYYSVMAFMKERQLVKALSSRVGRYFHLQWTEHEGVLIPNEKSAIWDAPKTLFQSVSFAQAQRYVSRIPLFMHCREDFVMDVCAALRQYIVPPKEALLYPKDQTRELYIIVKGFCRVIRPDGRVIGKLSEGHYFGLSGLIYGTNRAFRIETINYCQFFCLEFSTFVEVAKRYPKFLYDYKLLRGDASLPKGMDLFLPEEEWQVFAHKNVTLPEEPSTISTNDPSESAVDIETQPTTGHVSIDTLLVPSSTVKVKKMGFIAKIFGSWGIAPHGKFLYQWTIFRVICAFLVGNFALIQAVFSVHPKTALFTILFFDMVAWIDLIICFRIGYFGSENQLITAWRRTAFHYLLGPFILDVLGCLPFDHLIVLFHPGIKVFGQGRGKYNQMYHIISHLRINRVLQCYRLFVSGQILAKKIYKSLSILILLQVVPLMILFINIMTCMAVGSVCRASRNGEHVKCQKGAWIITGRLYENAPVTPETVMSDPVMSYIIAVYWATTSAYCVGFGDIDIIDDATNRKIAISIIYLGVVVTGFLVSKLTACLVGEDSRRVKIREKTRVMFKFLEQFGVKKELRRRTQEYYFGAWDKTRGIFPKDLFSALPPSLQSDVTKSLYQEKLKMSPIFLSCDEPGIRILCSKLEEMFYPEGEFLFQFGDLDGDVYFIAKGFVATYTERGDVISHIGCGSLIGEISCLFEVQRQYTAVAATDVEVYIFDKVDFLDFLSLYPKIKATLEEACIRHYKETIEVAANKSGSFKVILPAEEDANSSLQVEAMEGQLREIAEGHDEDGLDIRESTKSLAGMEADLGNAKEISAAECDKNPEFIFDPLRLPVTSSERGERKAIKMGALEKRKMSSYFLTFGKVPRDEMGLLHIVQDRNRVTCCNFVFHPMSPCCSWVSLFLFLTSLSCGLTAYEIAFHTTKEESTYLMAFRCCLEIFFLIRIFGSFHLGYYDEYGVIVADNVKIIKRYLYSFDGFLLDLLTTFPFYLVSYLVGGLRYTEIAADIRGLQLFRVFLFARYLKETETELRMKVSLVKILKISILLCFIFHFCACAWYLVACDGMKCRRGSWMSLLLKDMLSQKTILSSNEVSIGSRYLLSLYYVTTAITFTGLSDITPRTQVELCCTIAMIFTTVFVIGFLVGEMTQCLASQVKSKIHFRHKLNVMEHHFVALGLSPNKLNFVRKYFRLIWLRCNGTMYNRILSELPYSLRADIAMQVYGPNIRNSRILGRLDDIIIRQLCARVRHEIFIPGAHIIRSGSVCSAVYFIKKGEVVILDENSSIELCVDVLYENECFGEVKVLLSKEQFRFSYVARLETEVGVLFHEDLLDVLSRHPGLVQEMKERANRVKDQRIAMNSNEEERLGVGETGGGSFGASTSNVDLQNIRPKSAKGSRSSAIFGKGFSTK